MIVLTLNRVSMKKLVLFIFVLSSSNLLHSQFNNLRFEENPEKPWTLSISASHMNFFIPKTGNFLSSSINVGCDMKRISFSGWTGISVMAENGNLYPYFGLSSSQSLLRWSCKKKEIKPFSLSINQGLTCFYHPTWDYFLNITLNPSYSYKSFYFTSWLGYANHMEILKSFLTFGFSITKTLYSW